MENVLGAHTFRDYRFESIEQAGAFTLYKLEGSDGEGSGELRCYQVLPGILLTYDQLDMKSCYQRVAPTEGYMQINHCTQGSFEFELKNGQIYFMGVGDLCISNPWSRQFVGSRLPLGHYRGLSIILELETAQASINAFFPKAGIDIRRLRDQLLAKEASFLIRARTELDHMFAALYCVDERIRQPYCALKVLEILLFLHLRLDEPQEHFPRFSQSVVSRTKHTYEYLMKNNCQRTTVRALAERFHIAESVLQQCFKSIYGQPIASFLRAQRIQQSAVLLREDDSLSVGEIAQLAGYENQSKFASAFKAITGESPLAYRHRAAHIPANESEPK